jgi:hypothetical protein
MKIKLQGVHESEKICKQLESSREEEALFGCVRVKKLDSSVAAFA